MSKLKELGSFVWCRNRGSCEIFHSSIRETEESLFSGIDARYTVLDVTFSSVMVQARKVWISNEGAEGVILESLPYCHLERPESSLNVPRIQSNKVRSRKTRLHEQQWWSFQCTNGNSLKRWRRSISTGSCSACWRRNALVLETTMYFSFHVRLRLSPRSISLCNECLWKFDSGQPQPSADKNLP